MHIVYNLPKKVNFLRFSFEIIMIMRVLSKYIINKNLSIDKQKNNGLIKNKILFKSYYYDRFEIEHIDITNDNDIEKITLYLSRDIYEKITFLIYKDHIECFSDGKTNNKQTAYGKIKYPFKNFIKSPENDKLIY